MFLIGFPLLLIPFAIYNIVAFLMPGVGWSGVLITVHMMSGADWKLSAGDMLVALAILLLFGEMTKATRIGVRNIVDHGLSLILFLGMLVEFVLVTQAASATFFLLLVTSFFDVLGGFAVTCARAAERSGDRADFLLSARRFCKVRHDPRFPIARPLARHRLRRHGGDLASAGDAGRRRRVARGRQRSRRGGDRVRRALRGRAAYDRHRRRLLLFDIAAGQAGLGL